MKLINRIKFMLLGWLLDDICGLKYGCKYCHGCELDYIDPEDGAPVCGKYYALLEARKAWRLEESE